MSVQEQSGGPGAVRITYRRGPEEAVEPDDGGEPTRVFE